MLVLTREAAHEFCTKFAMLSLKDSQKRKAAARQKAVDDWKQVSSQVHGIYIGKVDLANEAYRSVIREPQAMRMQAVSEAQANYNKASEGPTRVRETARKASSDLHAAYIASCNEEQELRRDLAKEEFDAAVEMAQSSEERDKLKRILQAAYEKIRSQCQKNLDAGVTEHNSRLLMAQDVYNLATAIPRADLDEVLNAAGVKFNAINKPAQEAMYRAHREARQEREKCLKEAQTEYQRNLEEIDAQFASESRTRVAFLQSSRICINAYFDWLELSNPAQVPIGANVSR